MKKLCATAFVGILGAFGTAMAQQESDLLNYVYNRNLMLETSIGMAKGNNVNTLQITKFAWIDPWKILSVGGGFRAANVNYTNLGVQTYGSNKTGFQSFAASGNVVSVNFMVTAELNWKGKYTIGANTDLFGVGMGGISPGRDFTLTPQNTKEAIITPAGLGAVCGDFNVRKGRGKNIGTLHSDFYVSYHLKRNIWLKAGYTYTYTEMEMNQMGDRFGGYLHTFFIGLRLRY